jgi:hypothetical protein
MASSVSPPVNSPALIASTIAASASPRAQPPAALRRLGRARPPAWRAGAATGWRRRALRPPARRRARLPAISSWYRRCRWRDDQHLSGVEVRRAVRKIARQLRTHDKRRNEQVNLLRAQRIVQPVVAEIATNDSFQTEVGGDCLPRSASIPTTVSPSRFANGG